MATEEYSIGYDAGYLDGWNDAIDETPKQEPVAEPHKGEPVAWRTYTGRGYYVIDSTFEEAQKNWPDKTHQPLYTTPPQSEARGLSQQRIAEHKPLTDEQIDALYEKHVDDCWDSIEDQMGDPVRIMARAIEAAHGIKE